MTRRPLLPALFGLVLLTAATDRTEAAELGAKDEPIKLAINEWTGQHITTTIAGMVLQRMGYQVEYLTVGTQPQFTAIKDGDIDASLEIWPFIEYVELFDGLKDGTIVELGKLGLDPLETWYYPAYVEDDCPGLPDWRAVADCAALFSTPETAPSGRLLDYPADWASRNEERVAALDMDLVVIPAGSEGAEIAEIRSAFEREAPLLIQFWRPHWIHSEYDLRPVSLPPYENGCFEDPGIGPVPDKTYDCGWPKSDVVKIASADFAAIWPAAYVFLSGFELTNADQEPLMKQIDVEGEDLNAAVEGWLATHEETWKPLMESALSAN